MKITGKAWIFGDDIDTDAIIPGKYLRTTDMQVFADHVLEGIDPGFAKVVGRGDIIIAGRNFGCGSSREQAVLAIKHAGVGCVVAASFARIFFRNAINIGLPILESAEAAEAISDGDDVAFDLAAGTITSGGGTFSFEPYPPELQEIVEAGGLLPHVRARRARAT